MSVDQAVRPAASATLSAEAAAQILYREALFLDECRWDEWLELYLPQARYWVPAWKSEGEPTSDPEREISLIYYESRASLEDRIWRLKSGTSVASNPLRRTAHVVTNVLVTDASTPGEVEVKATFNVGVFDPRRKTSHAFFGRYLYRLKSTGDVWRIASKTIFLLNDQIPAVADVYML
ncbi:aromatic-ring-hydroxylating dioxygenase subunit beta [Brevundimonas sp.]|uniref:aromatic-ring-hydroxylating dioxygenase subunit beta n=1 Tax=Brevundimonas sp. TaxID=1871086 RepID=UPI003D104D8B